MGKKSLPFILPWHLRADNLPNIFFIFSTASNLGYIGLIYVWLSLELVWILKKKKPRFKENPKT